MDLDTALALTWTTVHSPRMRRTTASGTAVPGRTTSTSPARAGTG